MKLKQIWQKFYAHKNFFIAFWVVLLTISSIGISYSAFFSIKSNTNNQTISTGTLKVSYTGANLSASEALNTDNLMPLPDREGMNQGQARIINIINEGNLDSVFALTIGYDMEKFNGLQVDDKRLTPIELVRFAVYEYTNQESILVAGPLSIADLPIYENFVSDYRNNRYTILIDRVGKNGSGNSIKTYLVKTWLSDETPQEISNTYFYIDSSVVATVEGAKKDYTLSGKLVAASGEAIGDATINLQNSYYVKTNNLGEFTIEDVPDGTYNLDIINNEKTIQGNLTIQPSDSLSIINNGKSFTALGNDKIFAYAYSYGTTINKILKVNDLNTLTDSLVFENKAYNLASSFTLKAKEAKINNLLITLNEDNYNITLS